MPQVEYIPEKDAPAPPKKLSKTASQTLAILMGIKDGQVAKITVEEGGQTLRGMKASVSRVAKSHNLKVLSYEAPGEPNVLYVKKTK